VKVRKIGAEKFKNGRGGAHERKEKNLKEKRVKNKNWELGGYRREGKRRKEKGVVREGRKKTFTNGGKKGLLQQNA